MAASGKKKWLIVVLLVIVAGIAAAYYLYNKGPVNIENAAAKQINAAALYSEFIADGSTAQKNYRGKVLLVSGTVAASNFNQQGQQIIMLKTNNNSGFVNCSLEVPYPHPIQQNQPIQIKGICNGLGEADAALGIQPDLYIDRSIVQP